jgi:glycosyltransferase involved in cell wall biosynthesis
MRMLTLSNCPLDRSTGSGYVVMGFTDGLRYLGWTVDVLGSEAIDPFPGAVRARSWRMTLGMAIHAIRRVLSTTYDVVEFYGGEAWLAVFLLTRWPGRQFIVVSHSNGLEPHCREQLLQSVGADTLDGRPRRWYQLDAHALFASSFRRVDGLVTVSAIDREYAAQHRYQPDHRLLCIDNPLPAELLGQRVSLERRRTVVFCGSWVVRKGTQLVVADMTRLLAEFPDARLKLIGVGSQFRLTEHFPASLHGQIDVIPFLSDRNALRAAYMDCAVLIAPSHYESFGLVIAEAMACGCAVVASRTGFAANLTDGVEACLLPSAASPHLYSAVRNLLQDEALRKRVALAGYQRVQSLEWSAAASQLEASYRLWLAQFRAAQP